MRVHAVINCVFLLNHRLGLVFPNDCFACSCIIRVYAPQTYLSDEDFMSVFTMTKAEFAKIPGWRRDKLKKDAKLF